MSMVLLAILTTLVFYVTKSVAEGYYFHAKAKARKILYNWWIPDSQYNTQNHLCSILRTQQSMLDEPAPLGYLYSRQEKDIAIVKYRVHYSMPAVLF